MTRLTTLKRNLEIIALYDTGDYAPKEIKARLNIHSMWVIYEAIKHRIRYLGDYRSEQLQKLSKIRKQTEYKI